MNFLNLCPTDVNCGRQDEIDILKGLFIFPILPIHAFQMLGNQAASTSISYQWLFGLFMLTGAGLFLFLMGFGLAYTKKQKPGETARSGIRWVLYQLLCNVASAAAFALPMGVCVLLGSDTPPMHAYFDALLPSLLLLMNIFYITGMIQLVMALLRRVKTPLWLYPILAAAVAVVTPYAANLRSDNGVISVLLNLTFHTGGYVSFCFFPYISFTLAGYGFARLLRRAGDKNVFYARTLWIAAPLSGAYLLWVLLRYPDFSALYRYLGVQYGHPDFLKWIGTVSIILSMAAGTHFLTRWICAMRKTNAGNGWLLDALRFSSKHVSKLYAVHICVYAFAIGALGYRSFDAGFCWIIALPVSAITFALVIGYVRLRQRKKPARQRQTASNGSQI